MVEKELNPADDSEFQSDQLDENASYKPDDVDMKPNVKAADQLSNTLHESHETSTVNTEQSTHNPSASEDAAKDEVTLEEIVWTDSYSHQHMPHETEHHVPSAGPPSYTGYYVSGPMNGHAALTTNYPPLTAGYDSMGDSQRGWDTVDTNVYSGRYLDGSGEELGQDDPAAAALAVYSYLDAQRHTPIYPAGDTLILPPHSPSLETMDSPPRLEAAYAGHSPEEPTDAIPAVTYTATPDPTTPLLYPSAAAASAAQNNRILNWPTRTTHDPNFPHTPHSRAHYVHCLVSAMKDVSVAKDNRNNPAFKKRWLDPISRGEYAYSAEDFELACWGLVETAERLHTHGIACFSIYDSGTLDKAAREAGFTFGERIGVMCEYLRFTKGKVDSLMKGDGVETFVAITGGKLRESKLNRGKKTAMAVVQEEQQQQRPVQKVVEWEELPRLDRVFGAGHGLGMGGPRHTARVGFQQQLFEGRLPSWQPGSYPGIVSHEPVQQETGAAESWEPGVADSAAEPSRKRSLGTAQFQDDESSTARDAKRAK